MKLPKIFCNKPVKKEYFVAMDADGRVVICDQTGCPEIQLIDIDGSKCFIPDCSTDICNQAGVQINQNDNSWNYKQAFETLHRIAKNQLDH